MTRTERSEAIFPYSTLPKVWRPMCPLCTEVPRLQGPWPDRYQFPVSVGFCRCGLGWLTEQLTREGYDALYAGPYRRLVWSLDHPDKPYDADIEQAIRDKDQARYGKLIAQVVAATKLKARNLLDAGGSAGGLVEQLPSSTFDILTVLDPALKELTEKPLAVNRGRIHSYLEDQIPGLFDGILCARTIDHLTDPLTAFRNMRAACPNGWLLFDFVDLATLPWSRRTYPLAVELKIDHPLYWNLNAAKTCLGLTGWKLSWTAAIIEPRTRTEHVFCVAR